MSVVDTNGEWPGVLWRQKPILRVMHARIPTCRLISLGHATQTASRANLIFQNTNTNLETRLVLKKHKLRLSLLGLVSQVTILDSVFGWSQRFLEPDLL